jgi:stress response protein YsnF
VDWVEKSVHVNMTKEQVENSPDYDPLEPINREYEERLYNYYGQPVYW